MITNLNDFRKKVNEARRIYSIGELYPIERWIKSVWERLNTLAEEKLFSFFEQIENSLDKVSAAVINRNASADYLHYHQNGATAATGGIDTHSFIQNFEDVKGQVENLLVSYGVNENWSSEPNMSTSGAEPTLNDRIANFYMDQVESGASHQEALNSTAQNFNIAIEDIEMDIYKHRPDFFSDEVVAAIHAKQSTNENHMEINEGTTTASLPNVTTAEQLKAHITHGVQKAMDVFTAQQKMPKITVDIQGEYLRGLSQTFTEDELGVFKHGVKHAQIQISNSSKIQVFEGLFSKTIWGTFVLRYEVLSGGSNGVEYNYTEGSNQFMYDIIENKFYTRKDYFSTTEKRVTGYNTKRN